MKARMLKVASSVLFVFSLNQFANAEDHNIEVTPIQDVTSQELAAIYVLSDICPALVSDKMKFDIGYKKLTKEYLPKENDPIKALNTLVKQSSFKAILDEAKSDAKNEGKEKNKAICEDVVNYNI